MKQLNTTISQSSAKAKIKCRDEIELLYSRVSLLNGKDKLLMTMHLQQGNTFRQLAQLAGVNETTIARRIRKIKKRLINSKYITCLRNRSKFTKDELEIAREHFLMGLAMRKIAEEHQLSYYHVRKTIKKIRQVVKASNSNSHQLLLAVGQEQQITNSEI